MELRPKQKRFHIFHLFSKIKTFSCFFQPNNVLGAQPYSRIGEYQNARKEVIYESTKTEPLGRAGTRNTLPEDKRELSFGKPTTSSESAMNLLFPKDSKYLSGEMDRDEETRALYLKSHGTYDAGEQRSRGYNWKGIDPSSHRFGAVDKDGIPDGVKKALNPAAATKTGILPTEVVPIRVAEFRKYHEDELGKPRNLGLGKPNLPEDHSFGMPSMKEPDWGARECIQGAYTEDEQQPDRDLGRGIVKGAAPKHLIESTSSRIFGVPSVRDDIKPPAKRSVADPQNYGDEPSVKELLYPAPYATRGVNEGDFLRPMPKEKLKDIMMSSGALNNEEVFESVWRVSAGGMGDDENPLVSIDAFRRKMMEMTLR